MKPRIEIWPRSEIKENLFVRTQLNPDHVLYLAGLIENGVKLPPIKITREGVIIDGRHRFDAYNYITKPPAELECEVVEVEDEADMISKAYLANVGGSLPPTTNDTEHTIKLLLERNEPQKNIAALLGLPLSLAKKYVQNVSSKISRQKMQHAMAAVGEENMTIAQAAEKFGVDFEKLKNVVTGRRRKSKKGLADLQSEVTRIFKSKNSKTAAILKKLSEMFEDGDVTPKDVDEILEHIQNLNGRAGRIVEDWKNRFQLLKGNGSK